MKEGLDEELLVPDGVADKILECLDIRAKESTLGNLLLVDSLPLPP
jgi:hypothetical protein